MNQPQAGDRVNNYLLEERVGEGSFGQVWRARHHVLEQVVAIKILTDAQYVRNFRQEGVVVHGLRHPNIVRAMDIDPYADWPYLIMEFVPGPSLRQLIDQHPSGMPVGSVQNILHGMLAGLQAAHDAGLVHRDIKPANILLRLPVDEVGRIEPGDVKLTDFGLGRATSVTTTSLMQSGSLVTDEGKSVAGTLVYMSPEQRAGEDLDGRSDLYSCAVVLFEMLTGARPAGSDLPSMVRPGLVAAWDQIFRRSYTRLATRYASATEMLADLQRLAAVGGTVDVAPVARAGEPVGGAGRSGTPVPVRGRGADCPSCGRSAQVGDNFCIHCGTQLASTVRRCGACRAFVGNDDRFCIFCGMGLSSEASAPS